MQRVSEHGPIINTITSYLDPRSIHCLTQAYPNLRGVESMENSLKYTVRRALPNFFEPTEKGRRVAATILNAIEQEGSIYALTGSFLVQLLRGDDWECNDLDIIVAQNFAPGNNWCSLGQELVDDMSWFLKRGNEYEIVPSHDTSYNKTLVDHMQVPYADERLVWVSNHMCASKKIQFLYVKSISDANMYVNNFDLQICRNFYGFGGNVWIENVNAIMEGYCQINLEDTYAKKILEDPLLGYDTLFYGCLPYRYNRLNKYINRGFRIRQVCDPYYPFQNRYIQFMWHQFWHTRVTEDNIIVPDVPVDRPQIAVRPVLKRIKL